MRKLSVLMFRVVNVIWLAPMGAMIPTMLLATIAMCNALANCEGCCAGEDDDNGHVTNITNKITVDTKSKIISTMMTALKHLAVSAAMLAIKVSLVLLVASDAVQVCMQTLIVAQWHAIVWAAPAQASCLLSPS